MARKNMPMPGESWLSRVRFWYDMLDYGKGKLVAALVLAPCALLGLWLLMPVYSGALPVASACALAVLTGIAIPVFILFGLPMLLALAGVCAVVCGAECLFGALGWG